MRELRTAAQKTAAEVAEQAGMTEAVWLSVEQGRRAPTLGSLLGMARALGCDVGELFVGVGAGVRPISAAAEQAAALFDQCPTNVQESILKLLREVSSRRKKR